LCRGEIKAKGNLSIPQGLTLQQSRDALVLAKTTSKRLTAEAIRFNDRAETLNSLHKDLATWLIQAGDHNNYQQTAEVTSKVSDLFRHFAAFITADKKHTPRSISRDDLKILSKALGQTQPQVTQSQLFKPSDAEAGEVLKGVSGTIQSQSAWTADRVYEVAAEWKRESGRVGEALRKANASVDVLKKSKASKKDEHEKQVQSLNKQLAEKEKLLSQAEANANEHRSNLEKVQKESDERQEQLEIELEDALQKVRDIEERYTDHIEFTQQPENQDTSTLDEVRAAFASFNVECPQNIETTIGYLHHALERLGTSQAKAKRYKDRYAEFQTMVDEAGREKKKLESDLKKSNQALKLARDSVHELAAKSKARKETIADQEGQIRDLTDNVEEKSHENTDLKRQRDKVQSKLERARSEISALKASNKANESLKTEFNVLSKLFGLGRDVRPAQLTKAVTNLHASSKKQQSANDNILLRRAIEAETALTALQNMGWPEKLNDWKEKYNLLAEEKEELSSELKDMKIDLAGSKQLLKTRWDSIREMGETISNRIATIKTLETQTADASTKIKRLEDQISNLRTSLESALGDNQVLSDQNEALRNDQTAIQRLQQDLGEAKRQLEDCRANNRELDSNFVQFLNSMKRTLHIAERDKATTVQIIDSATKLYAQVDGIRITLDVYEEDDIHEYIMNKMFTEAQVEEQISDAMKPLMDILRISDQDEIEAQVQLLVTEKDEILSHLGNITPESYVTEVMRLMRSHQALNEVDIALQRNTGDSSIDRIDKLQDSRTRLLNIQKELNVISSTSVITVIKRYKEIRTEINAAAEQDMITHIKKHKTDSAALRQIYDALQVSTVDAVTDRAREHQEIYQALGSPQAGTATTVIGALKTEHDEIYQALDSPQPGKATKAIDDLDVIKTEHTEIYNALDYPEALTAAAVIRGLKNTEAQHNKVSQALSSPSDGIDKIITTLKNTNTEHEKIYKALNSPKAGTATVVIEDLNKIKTAHTEMVKALDPPEGSQHAQVIKDLKEKEVVHNESFKELGSPQAGMVAAIKTLNDTNAEYKSIYEALDSPEAGTAVAVIKDLKKIETKHQQIQAALELVSDYDLEDITAEHDALESNTENEAVTAIEGLKKIKAAHEEIYKALNSSPKEGEAVKAIDAFKKIKTAHEEIYKALDFPKEGEAVEAIEGLKRTKADSIEKHEKIKAANEEIYKALDFPKEGEAVEAIEGLKRTKADSIEKHEKIKAANEEIYKALDFPKEGEAVKAIGALKDVELAHTTLKGLIGDSAELSSDDEIKRLQRVADDYTNLVDNLTPGDNEAYIEEITKLKASDGTHKSIAKLLSAENDEARIKEVTTLKAGHEAYQLITHHLPAENNEARIEVIKKLKTSDGTHQLIAKLLSVENDEARIEEVRKLKVSDGTYRSIAELLSTETDEARIEEIRKLKDSDGTHKSIAELLSAKNDKARIEEIRKLKASDGTLQSIAKLLSAENDKARIEEIRKLNNSHEDLKSVSDVLSAITNEKRLAEIDRLQGIEKAFNSIAEALPATTNEKRLTDIGELKDTLKAFNSIAAALPAESNDKRVDEIGRLRVCDEDLKSLANALFPPINNQSDETDLTLEAVTQDMPARKISDYIDEVKKLKDVEALQKKIINALPANQHGPEAEVKRLTDVEALQKKIINALPANQHGPVAEVKRLTNVETVYKDIIDALSANKQTPVAEVERLTEVDSLQKKILELLPGHEQDLDTEVKRLTEVDSLQKKILELLPGHEQDLDTEVERLTEVDSLQKKILELLPEHEQDLDIEVDRLKGSDKTLRKIEDTLKLDSDLDLVTEIKKHQLARSILTETEAKLAPGEQSVPEKIEEIRTHASDRQTDLDNVDRALELGGQERLTVIGKLQSDLKDASAARDKFETDKNTAETELGNIEQALLPQSEHRSNIDAIKEIRRLHRLAGQAREENLRNLNSARRDIQAIENALVGLREHHGSVYAINKLRTDLRAAENARDRHQSNHKQAQDTLNDINAALARLRAHTDVDETLDSEDPLVTITNLQEQIDEIETTLKDLGAPIDDLSFAQSIRDLTLGLLKALRDSLEFDTTVVTLHPRLAHRLLTAYHWENDDTVLQTLDLGWQLVTRTSGLPNTFDQIVSRLRLLLLSENPVPLQLVEAMFKSSGVDDLGRLVVMLEILWADGPGLLDEVHAFLTARMIEFMVRGGLDRTEGATYIFRLCETWRTTYQVREPLLAAYSRWFESFEGSAPSTLLHELDQIQQDGDVEIMREPNTSRVFHCNVLPGYHLLADDGTLLLVKEASLSLNIDERLISFHDNLALPFTTNLPSQRLSYVIGRYMRGLWLRGQRGSLSS
jgi:chromosome segregation ATPase